MKARKGAKFALKCHAAVGDTNVLRDQFVGRIIMGRILMSMAVLVSFVTAELQLQGPQNKTLNLSTQELNEFFQTILKTGVYRNQGLNPFAWLNKNSLVPNAVLEDKRYEVLASQTSNDLDINLRMKKDVNTPPVLVLQFLYKYPEMQALFQLLIKKTYCKSQEDCSRFLNRFWLHEANTTSTEEEDVITPFESIFYGHRYVPIRSKWAYLFHLDTYLWSGLNSWTMLHAYTKKEVALVLDTEGFRIMDGLTFYHVNYKISLTYGRKGYLVGTTPSFDLALFTLCALHKPNGECLFQKDSFKYSIKVEGFDKPHQLYPRNFDIKVTKLK